jgi:hypothetical protein
MFDYLSYLKIKIIIYFIMIYFINKENRIMTYKIAYLNIENPSGQFLGLKLAYLLTKPLGRIRFLELCSKTGIVQISHKTMHKT